VILQNPRESEPTESEEFRNSGVFGAESVPTHEDLDN